MNASVSSVIYIYIYIDNHIELINVDKQNMLCCELIICFLSQTSLERHPCYNGSQMSCYEEGVL